MSKSLIEMIKGHKKGIVRKHLKGKDKGSSYLVTPRIISEHYGLRGNIRKSLIKPEYTLLN